jgi:hypothetical protein
LETKIFVDIMASHMEAGVGQSHEMSIIIAV